MIHAVGIGPGDLTLLTVRARQLLETADLVAGFETVLRIVDGLSNGRPVVLTYQNQQQLLLEVAAAHRDGNRCVVCFMGDPNFSGRQLLERVEGACGEPVEVVPGISSAQVAAGRSGLALEDAVLVTFHKRGELETDQQFLAQALEWGRGAIVLPRPWDFMPPDIARDLIRRGVEGGRRAIVYEALCGQERCWEGTLATLEDEFSDLSILVIR